MKKTYFFHLLKNSHLLLGMLFLGLFVVYKSYSATFNFQLVMLMTIFYVGLAYLYHHFDKTLTTQVIIEYVLLGALVLLILQSFSF